MTLCDFQTDSCDQQFFKKRDVVNYPILQNKFIDQREMTKEIASSFMIYGKFLKI